MRTCVIMNPKAGSAEPPEWLEEISRRFDCTIHRTAARGDATRLAAAAAEQGFETLIAAGGDGTVHEIINGMMTQPASTMRLGVIPLGTGNDFVRTLAISDDPFEAIEIIERGRERVIDLMKVQAEQRTLYACNVAAGGFTGQMNEAMTAEIKQAWGPLAYLRGALEVLPDLTSYETTMRLDDGPAGLIDAYNIIVANCRTAGGGVVVAPRANPEDGLLDVVIVHRGTIDEMAAVGASLLGGDYTQSDQVRHYRARRVSIRSNPGMWFNVDGELITNEPVEFEVVPGRLRVIVGELYDAEASATP